MENTVSYSEKDTNTAVPPGEWTHIDDDVMAFIFQSHAELELGVVDEVHILLQHLQIMGNCSEVHAGTGREAVLLQHDVPEQGRCSSAGCPPLCESQRETSSWCSPASSWCWTDCPHQTRISTWLSRRELWECTAFLKSGQEERKLKTVIKDFHICLFIHYESKV